VIVQATGDQQRIAIGYLARKLEVSPEALTSTPYSIFLACKGNDAKGVVLYKNYASGDIEMVCAGEPGWVTPGLLKFVLSYPFEQLNCNRITCLAHRKNKAMRNYLLRMGFKLEGVKRKALNGADLFMYGLLKGENSWH
jgi:hypothetical protein